MSWEKLKILTMRPGQKRAVSIVILAFCRKFYQSTLGYQSNLYNIFWLKIQLTFTFGKTSKGKAVSRMGKGKKVSGFGKEGNKRTQVFKKEVEPACCGEYPMVSEDYLVLF